MSASQVGAYASQAVASYAFNERARSGVEVSRVNASQETPQFKASLNNVQTRVGADESANANETKKRSSGGDAQAAGRGRFVDILA